MGYGANGYGYGGTWSNNHVVDDLAPDGVTYNHRVYDESKYTVADREEADRLHREVKHEIKKSGGRTTVQKLVAYKLLALINKTLKKSGQGTAYLRNRRKYKLVIYDNRLKILPTFLITPFDLIRFIKAQRDVVDDFSRETFGIEELEPYIVTDSNVVLQYLGNRLVEYGYSREIEKDPARKWSFLESRMNRGGGKRDLLLFNLKHSVTDPEMEFIRNDQ